MKHIFLLIILGLFLSTSGYSQHEHGHEPKPVPKKSAKKTKAKQVKQRAVKDSTVKLQPATLKKDTVPDPNKPHHHEAQPGEKTHEHSEVGKTS